MYDISDFVWFHSIGRKIIALILIAIPTGLFSQSTKDSVQVYAPSPSGAMVRSALLPGWGQLYNQKGLKALIVLGIEGGLAANAAHLNSRALSSATEDERQFYKENRNETIWWFFGFYLLNILDAYVDAQLFTFDVSPDLSDALSTSSYAIRFSVSLN